MGPAPAPWRVLHPRLVLLWALLAVGATVGLGASLRLQDPIGDPVMAAEDSYTHMLLVREHLRDGRIDPQFVGGSLYPPGLHGLLAAWWTFAGADLYDLMRFAPIAFGIIGLAGIAVLVGPREGAAAAALASLSAAVMPELILRTTLMTPSALDLALLPAALAMTLLVAQGRLRWAVPLMVLVGFMVAAHPWVVGILAIASLGFLAFAIAFPWSPRRGPATSAAGLAALLGVVGGGLALAAATRWDQSNSGFADLARPLLAQMGTPGIALAVAGIVLVVVLGVLGPRLPARLRPPAQPSAWVRVAAVAVLGALVALVVAEALQDGMPKLVNMPHNVGWPLLVLGVLGLLMLPFGGSPTAHLAGALFATTLPFVLLDVLNSPMWPHRAVAYLGLATVLLAGIAVARLFEAAQRAGAWLAGAIGTRLGRRTGSGHARQRLRILTFAALTPALLVVSGAGVALLDETPPPPRWYRLFNACEIQALREIGAQAAEEPKAIYLVDGWRTQLVLSSFSTHNQRFWISGKMYDEDTWAATVKRSWLFKKSTYLVLDHYADLSASGDPTHLDATPWILVEDHCADSAPVKLYKLDNSAWTTWVKPNVSAAPAPPAASEALDALGESEPSLIVDGAPGWAGPARRTRAGPPASRRCWTFSPRCRSPDRSPSGPARGGRSRRSWSSGSPAWWAGC